MQAPQATCQEKNLALANKILWLDLTYIVNLTNSTNQATNQIRKPDFNYNCKQIKNVKHIKVD